MNEEFTPLSFVKVRLLREVIYRKDRDDWETLRSNVDKIRHYFGQIGLQLVVDDAEGFAFLQQIEINGVDRVPRLTQKRPLNYQTTLLLVCLREEFCRFDTKSPDETRLTKTSGELQNLLSAFIPDSTNQVRDASKINSAVQRMVDLGFLEKISDDPETFEVKPIVKAKIGPEQLRDIKERLQQYAKPAPDQAK